MFRFCPQRPAASVGNRCVVDGPHSHHSASPATVGTKLKSEFPDLLPIKESLVKYVFGVQKKQAVASDKVATGV